jgi:hypothetical protein
MSSYLERLEGARERLPFVETRVALLTGQSSFASSALSAAQIGFLRAVAPAGASVLEMGFPFDSGFCGGGFREVGMVAASARNARQVGWALRSARFRAVVARRLEELLAGSARLILITGSCGLQIANSAWPAGGQAEVVALGPACFGTLRVPARVVQGRADGWSRLFYRGRVDRYCDCGHLGYWEAGDVQAVVAEWVR